MKENDWQLMQYFFLWLALPFTVALSFHGIFSIREKICKNTCYSFFGHHFICIAIVKSLQSSRFFQTILSNYYYWKVWVNPKRKNFMWKLWYPNYKKQYCTSQEEMFCWYIVLYSLYQFLHKIPKDLNYHIAKKNSAPNLDVTFKCKLCYRKFPGFYALRQHRNTQHGMQIGSRTRDVNLEHIVGNVEDHSLREELRSCQLFMVDSELERTRLASSVQLRCGNSKRNNRERETWSIFQQFEMCSKINLAFGFISKNKKDGGFRYFYAHESNTPLDRSKLVCIHVDLAELKDFLNKTGVIESCSRERMNTKWRFYKLTNLTVFAALLKDVPMGCRDAVVPEPLLRNGTINCLTFEENTRQPYNDKLCLFRNLALHMHGN